MRAGRKCNALLRQHLPSQAVTAQLQRAGHSPLVRRTQRPGRRGHLHILLRHCRAQPVLLGGVLCKKEPAARTHPSSASRPTYQRPPSLRYAQPPQPLLIKERWLRAGASSTTRDLGAEPVAVEELVALSFPDWIIDPRRLPTTHTFQWIGKEQLFTLNQEPDRGWPLTAISTSADQLGAQGKS